jgi:hypothetical protein
MASVLAAQASKGASLGDELLIQGTIGLLGDSGQITKQEFAAAASGADVAMDAVVRSKCVLFFLMATQDCTLTLALATGTKVFSLKANKPFLWDNTYATEQAMSTWLDYDILGTGHTIDNDSATEVCTLYIRVVETV